MKWWYTPQDAELYKWDDYDDVVFAIAAMCRFKIDKHIVPNYYIYNDNGLIDIIKGSEIDPLSLLRYGESFNDFAEFSEFSEECEDPDDEFQRLLNIVSRQYKRTNEQLKEAHEAINKCNVFEEETDMTELFEKVAVKEYAMKYIHGDNSSTFVKNIFYIEQDKLESMLDRDLRNIPIILKESYDLASLTEEYCVVFAYNGETMIGFSIISHGTASNCDMDAKVIFRFLLLICATDYVIVHNHPLGKPDMSQADYNITKSLLEASDFMNINMIEHIIIGKDDYSEILMQIREMDSEDITDVRQYYSECYSA